MPKTDRSVHLVKCQLCIRNPHCGHKMVLGRVIPWDDGQGSQQRIWCVHCPAEGIVSSNHTKQKPSAFSGIVIPHG